MAKVKTTNTVAAYQAEITLNFYYRSMPNATAENIEIEPSRIQYLMIDYKYESVNILPIIYVSLKLPLDLHDKILDSYDISNFYLKITKKNVLAANSVATPHVEDIFSYICSNQEQNSAKNLNDDGQDDRSYVDTTIGLISTNMINNLRKTYNAFYNGANAEQLIKEVALKGLGKKLIMSPLKYNNKVDTFIVPPTNSRFRLLERIFDKLPFYDTTFTFFMDFNQKVYFLDKTGTAVPDGKISKIYIEITELDNRESMMPGITHKDSALYLKVNATQSKITIDESMGQRANQIVGYKYNEENQNLTVTDQFMEQMTPKQEFIKTENAAAIKNDIVNSSVCLSVYKQSIDPEYLTPNKEYIITQTSNYEKYNGTFILYYKQELYIQNGAGENTFNETCTAGFKRINAIEVAKAKKDTSISVRKRRNKKTSKKKSSADNKKASKKSTSNDRKKK